MALGGVALGQNGDACHYGASGQGHQVLHGLQAAAGGDHVVHQDDALAPDQVRVIPAQIQLLGAGSGDGLILHMDGVGHIGLGTLPGDEVLLGPGLAGHFVDQELCITDHVDTIHWGTLAPRDDFDWEESRRQFHEAQALWGDRITLRRGAELGEAQLSFDRADRLLAGEELDFVIGSVHLSGKKFANMDLYYIEKGSEAYYDSVIDSYLDDVLALARWGRFQVLGHLTLPLRYINEHHGEHMTFRRHMDRVEEIFRAIIPQGVGIECNTNRGNEPLPGEEILRLYRSLGGEIITLGSDAHRPEDVGCFIRQRQELLRTCGFRYFTTFERGRPQFQAL